MRTGRCTVGRGTRVEGVEMGESRNGKDMSSGKRKGLQEGNGRGGTEWNKRDKWLRRRLADSYRELV